MGGFYQENTIHLSDFEVVMDIGIHAFEVGKPQRVLVSVDVGFALEAERVAEDALVHTLDYDRIVSAILTLAKARRYNTQETFAYALLAEIAREPRALHARVMTKKPDVFKDCAYVGFSVNWTR